MVDHSTGHVGAAPVQRAAKKPLPETGPELSPAAKAVLTASHHSWSVDLEVTGTSTPYFVKHDVRAASVH